jgi:GNAT superfamily N-acetyltransferase
MSQEFDSAAERSPVDIIEADLGREEHQEAVVEMVNAYSLDPMGGGEPLSEEIRRALIPGLQQHPTTLIFLAYQGDQPVGIAVCFLGFSTFSAKPLINIHDLSVIPECRGQGVGRQLLEAVAQKGRELGCCKLTLEVLEYNHRAKRVYEGVGFAQAGQQKGAGGALFYSKSL